MNDRYLKLYHWSPYLKGKFAVVDPDCFLTKRHFYTRNDFDRSSIPRSFFYLDTAHKEKLVSGMLYTTIIPASDLYDLNEDVMELRLQVQAGYKSNINVGCMNFTELMDLIYTRLIKSGRYNGIYYGKQIKTACMFVPVEVERVKK